MSFADSTPRGSRANLEPIEEINPQTGEVIDRAATFTVRINRVERKLANESEHPQPAESTVIECEVVESNNPKCPPGYTASVVFTDRYFQDLYFGEVKGFLCGLLNASPNDIDDNDWNAVAGRFDLNCPEGADLNEWLASEDVANLVAWREGGAVLGALVKVTVRFKRRKEKHPIREYAWAPSEQQHPGATE